jgi:flagellar biosynthetic protein FliR
MSETMLLVLARSAGMVFRAPGFSHPSVPAMVRAGFALALAFAIAPHVGSAPELAPIAFVFAIVAEAGLGAAIGTGASLLYDGAYYAGRMIDDYVGVRGSVPNAAVASAQGFGRLWSSVFLAGFFLLDGYVPVVNAFAVSFERIAPAAFVTTGAWSAYALALPATIVRASLLVAAPALAVALTVQVALAAAGRVVPRFGSFTLTFPIVFASAAIVTIVGIPLVTPLAAHPWLVLPFRLDR